MSDISVNPMCCVRTEYVSDLTITLLNQIPTDKIAQILEDNYGNSNWTLDVLKAEYEYRVIFHFNIVVAAVDSGYRENV